MSGDWIVVQSAGEVSRALALQRATTPPPALLATSAGAYYALQEANAPCRSAHEYLTRDSSNRMAWENFDKLRRLTLHLDESAHAQISHLPDGFKPFESIEFDFKKLADSFSFAAAELSGFCRAEAPDEMLYWDGSPEIAANEDSWPAAHLGTPPSFEPVPGNQSFVSRLLTERDQWTALGAETRRLPTPEDAVIPRRGKRLYRRVREQLNPNRTEAVRLLGSAIGSFNWRRGVPRLLVIGKSDNSLSFLKYALSSKRVQVDWWTHDQFAPVRLPTLGGVRSNGASPASYRPMGELALIPLQPNGSGAFKFGDGDGLLYGVLLERLSAFWRWRMPRLYSLYARAIAYFESQRSVGVICGTAHADRFQVVGQAATASGVPLVSFQHGGSYGYMECEWLKLSDLRADIYAGFGPDGCAYLEDFSRGRGLAARAVDIGWAHGADMVRRSKETARPNGRALPRGSGRGEAARGVVLYVPTGLSGETRYGPDRFRHDTDYCLEQVSVIKALRQVPDTVLAVKLHPKDIVDNPMDFWIQQLGEPRVRVIADRPLPEVLESIDVAVFDFPTTTLLEVMASGKRLVYLHSRAMRWTPDGEALMRDTAPWVDIGEGWEERLRDAVAQALKGPAPDPESNRFLSAYASLDFRPDLVWDLLQEVRGGVASERH